MKLLLAALLGVVLLGVVARGAVVTCPHCVCPPSFSPVCGYRSSDNTTRGFSSRCVLECSNKCRRKKYEFVANGRCGKWRTSTSTETPTTLGALEVAPSRR